MNLHNTLNLCVRYSQHKLSSSDHKFLFTLLSSQARKSIYLQDSFHWIRSCLYSHWRKVCYLEIGNHTSEDLANNTFWVVFALKTCEIWHNLSINTDILFSFMCKGKAFWRSTHWVSCFSFAKDSEVPFNSSFLQQATLAMPQQYLKQEVVRLILK